MIEALYDMYDKSLPGDIIWAQMVGMQNYPGDLHEKVINAASKGVSWKFIMNKDSPALQQMINIFEPIKSAKYVVSNTNRLRVQGLSSKEIIIAFPTLTAYTAIRFTDAAFIEIIRNWFDQRFEELSR